MCEFCTEHGEGQVWYRNLKNYGDDLLSQDGRSEQIRRFFQDFEAGLASSLPMLDAIQSLPFIPNLVSRELTRRQKRSHFGQVVPIEDVDQILAQISSVVRLPCVCRSATTGRRETRFCYGLNVNPASLIGDFPDYGNHLEVLEVEQARHAIHQLDKEGLVHSVWTFNTPFIGGLCNCDQDCMAYRMQVGTGLTQVFFPAEYVAGVDWDRCSGCKLCRGHCPFGAIRYSASADKCLVDPNLCYGCGVCRAICKKEAITLEPRQRAFRWQHRTVQPGQHRIQVKPCRQARDCRKCLETCPAQVFIIAPQAGRSAGVPASDWRIYASLPSRCTGCKDCVTACPEGAITVG